MTAILAAVLLAPPSPALNCRDAACRVSADSTQSPAAPAENPQNPASDQAQQTTAAEPRKSENSPETPPAKEAEKPSPEKPNPETSNTEKAPSPASAVRKRHSRAHKPVTPAGNGEPRKIVVHQGGASDPVAQIVPGITQEEARHQRESAEQLLASTESHLKQLAARTLNRRQQEAVTQIHHYIDGARSALQESDTQRAHTLAQKAYLLSDDLVKH